MTIEQQDNVTTLLPDETVPPGDRIYEVRMTVYYPVAGAGGQTPQVTVVMQFDRPADASGPCPPKVSIDKDMKEGYRRDEGEIPKVLRVLHPDDNDEGGATLGNTGVGAPFEYLINVVNESDCPAHVVITDHVPAGLKVTGHDAGRYMTVGPKFNEHEIFDTIFGNRVTGAAGHPAADGGFDEKFVLDLDPHDFVTLRIHVTPQVPGSSFINTAHGDVTGQGPVDTNATELEVTPMPEASGLRASAGGIQGNANAGSVPGGKSSSAGSAASLPRDYRLSKVQVAVLAARKPGCRWLRSARGRFKTVKPGPGGACPAPVWITARGTAHWRLKFRRPLPRGNYLVYARALNRAGVGDVRAKALKKHAVNLRVR